MGHVYVKSCFCVADFVALFIITAFLQMSQCNSISVWEFAIMRPAKKDGRSIYDGSAIFVHEKYLRVLKYAMK